VSSGPPTWAAAAWAATSGLRAGAQPIDKSASPAKSARAGLKKEKFPGPACPGGKSEFCRRVMEPPDFLNKENLFFLFKNRRSWLSSFSCH
jgi:hypothetical protein